MLNENKDYKYIITSGWWCGSAVDEQRVRQGSEAIREVAFFEKWKESILQNANPEKIMVLDSASEITPPDKQKNGIEFISLTTNPGHSTHHSGKYSGYMRSVLMGITYAKLCDADYWVYVEQDALLKGKGIIEACISTMKKPYMFGSGEGTPQFLQQSLIIIRKDGYTPFLKNIEEIQSPDSIISPETKFLIASTPWLRFVPEFIYAKLVNKTRFYKYVKRLLNIINKKFKNYDHLPFGYGRTRPINFKDKYYYFQHGSDKELEMYFKNVKND